MTDSPSRSKFPVFDRRLSQGGKAFTVIGTGAIGGKAAGLALLEEKVLSSFPDHQFRNISIQIPKFTVLASDCFDAFMELNDLYDIASAEMSDDRIAHHFMKTELPPVLSGDLRSLLDDFRGPLAVRSSSLLEDAMFEPFAGIYATKMIPNNQPDLQSRFRSLYEAIKYVYASTYFAQAKNYVAGTSHSVQDEKMCVIIQEVMGMQHYTRFYPNISGVAKSYNFYPSGKARPEQGVVNLALGLGKAIVDGGFSWSYSPAFPRSKPPFGSSAEFAKYTQNRFWAVNLGKPPEHDPLKETEYLIESDLKTADYDNVLRHIVSTYDHQSDRMNIGYENRGVKVITFAPVLDMEVFPLNRCLKDIMESCENALKEKVEIEFAVTFDNDLKQPVQFGLLQARPMVVSSETVHIDKEEMISDKILAASDKVTGNGCFNDIQDIVYVKPEVFEAKNTPRIVQELEQINRTFHKTGRKYLLIGFGRWGSSDHWLGIPVNWGQINHAQIIIEATLPNMYVDPSQGSHFFHNLSSFQVGYFTIRHSGQYEIKWRWLDQHEPVKDLPFTRHIRLEKNLVVKIDGRHSRGLILHG
jgi:hypothetical protein